MKLRFRQNSLRLRLNRHEVALLAEGQALREVVRFPGSELTYVLQPMPTESPDASLLDNTIRITTPANPLRAWAESSEIGMYYELPTQTEPLRIAIEKDLECLDGPEEERDPYAFARDPNHAC